MMTLGLRLKRLRQELGLSQEAFGAQGFVSTPGWIKIENGQRQASEKLILQLCAWLVKDKHIRANAMAPLADELFTLKYLGNRSPFVRELAKAHARSPDNRLAHLLTEQPVVKPTRGRPPGKKKGVAA